MLRLSPESPRLLLTKRKVDEAEKVLRTIKRINKEEVPDNFRQELESISNEIASEKNYGASSIFKSKRMMYILLLLGISW